jgi:ubiquinone/menaquinone biosynthesis C-methylase UbiE
LSIDSRQIQTEYYRASVDHEFEVTRPHGCGRLYDYLITSKIRMALRSLPFPVAGRLVLNACCCSGMDLELVARRGARVVGLDLSKDAVRRAQERARRFGFEARLVVGDAELLPFRSDSVDVALVHDGLHHVPDPHRAIRELTRVGRSAVLLVEPANAALTRLSIRLGISGEYEDAGNYVYRLSRAELVSLFHSMRIRALHIKRYLMYYHHEPRVYYRLFDYAIPFRLIQAFFLIVNAVAGRWGNKIMCVALKDGSAR